MERPLTAELIEDFLEDGLLEEVACEREAPAIGGDEIMEADDGSAGIQGEARGDSLGGGGYVFADEVSFALEAGLSEVSSEPGLSVEGILEGGFKDEEADAAPAFEEAFIDEFIDGAAEGMAIDVEAFGEFALRGELFSRLMLFKDFLAKGAVNLEVDGFSGDLHSRELNLVI